MDTAKSLNDLSKIYLESVFSSEQSVDEATYPGHDEKGNPLKKEPKDNRHVVTYADKRGNTPAYQKLKAGDKNYKKADHLNNEEFIHRLEESGKFSIEEIQTILEAEVSVELEEEDKDLKKRAQFHTSRKEFKDYQQKKELKYWKTKKKNPVKAPNQQLKGFSNYVEGLEVKAPIQEPKEQVEGLGKSEVSAEEWKPDPVEKRKKKAADLYRREKIAQDTPAKYKTDKTEDPDKLYKRRMAVDSKTKMKEEVLDEVKVTRLDDKKKKEERAKNVKAMLARQAEWESEKKKALHASHEPEGEMVEAKVDAGKTPHQKEVDRNQRNTPPGANTKFDTSVFITRKSGESPTSARGRKRREAHAAKRGVK